jgi:hypothetical protein
MIADNKIQIDKQKIAELKFWFFKLEKENHKTKKFTDTQMVEILMRKIKEVVDR